MRRQRLIAATLLVLAAWIGGGSASILHTSVAARMARVHTTDLPTEDEERWYSLLVLDEHAGYVHTVRRAGTYAGADAIEETIRMRMELVRAGSALESTSTKTQYYRPGDGMLLYYEEVSETNGLVIHEEGRVADGVLVITTSTEESTTREEYPLTSDPPFLEQAMDAELERRGPLEVGDSFTVTGFDLDQLAVVDVTVQVLGEDVYAYAGEDIPVQVQQHTMGDLVIISWVAADGASLREDAGGFMSLRRCSREEALAAVDAVDVIRGTRVPLRGELPASAREALTVRATLNDGRADGLFAEDARQQVLAAADPRSVYVRIQPVRLRTDDILTLPVTGEEFLAYLAPTVYLESDHADMVAQAREIVGAETDAWRASGKLLTWVFHSIDAKNYSVGFASALQTLRSRAGDCTEHAVLFAALARAAGIPSKVCLGILVLPGGYGYYHAWASVYVGQWVAMDPTFNQHQADAMHLLLAESSGDAASMAQANMRLTRTMGELELEVWDGELPTAVILETSAFPGRCALLPNQPNPFNAGTLIRYALPRTGRVELVICDILGQEVARLVEAYQPRGEYSVVWDAAGVGSGVYFSRLISDTGVRTRSMVLTR